MSRTAVRLLVVSLLFFVPPHSDAAPLTVSVPAHMLAQQGSPDDQAWAMLRSVTPGTRLVVGRAMGAVAGSFVTVDMESITLKDAGYEGPRVVIPRSEVTTVLGRAHRQMAPHLMRGALIGAAAGTLMGVMVGEGLGNDQGVAVVAIGAVGAGIGLGMGAVGGLGSTPVPDVLYRRPGTSKP